MRAVLALSSVVAAVLATFLWFAYREVEKSLRAAAGQRAQIAADQTANLFTQSGQQALERLRVIAADPAVRRFLREPTDESREAARKRLLAPGQAGPRRIELWNESGSRVLEVVTPAPSGSPDLPAAERPADIGLGWLRAQGDLVFSDAVAEVSDDPGPAGAAARPARLGLVLARAPIRVNPPGIISRLVGDDAVVRIGSGAGGVWTDFSRAVPAPPVDVSRRSVAEYRDEEGNGQLGAVALIRGTPWAVWVQFRRAPIVAPARAFLLRMAALAAISLLAGAILIALLARRVTGPLREMAVAAEGVAGGDYSRRVSATGRDEIGRLGAAFNAMAAQIGDAYQRLEDAFRRLEGQRAFLRQVIDTSPNLIFAKDRQGRFTLANQAMADVYGSTIDALIGKTDADFNPNVEEVEAFRRGDLEAMDSGRETSVTEEVITDAAGKRRTFYTLKRPLLGPDGVADQVLGVATDVTEHRRAEEQLLHSQKIDAVGQLAGGVAHDFNNLIGVIFGYSDLLASQLGADHEGLRRVDEIRKAAHRAASLTRQLLAFGRKQILQPKVLDLNAVVTGSEGMLRRLIPAHIQIVAALQEGLGRVKADPGQIEQVIVNLAVNARDAMPQGGRLILETANVDFDDSYLRTHPGGSAGPKVMLAVSDTGHGMDRETQARVFEPFFTTKESGKGTGLGLSTVYGIVKQSGGYIMVYSEPGQGTTFKTYLPRVEEEIEAPLREEPAATVRPAASSTVLLAEDEPALREIIHEILEDGGYTVLEAPTPGEALSAAQTHEGPIRLLLTDLVMPGMSGRELARQVAARRPGLKVLYMSGYTDQTVMHDGALEPGTEFIQKPFTTDALLRKVHQILGDAEDGGGLG